MFGENLLFSYSELVPEIGSTFFVWRLILLEIELFVDRGGEQYLGDLWLLVLEVPAVFMSAPRSISGHL